MYKNQKIPLLEEGTAQRTMKELLTIIKSHRGLTSHIERKGINGKWLNPEMPYDIPFSKLIKILDKAARFRQNDELYMDEWKHMCELFLKILKG